MTTNITAAANTSAEFDVFYLTPESAALHYAERGLSVFPVWQCVNGICACPKGTDCPKPGKHPAISKGFKNATTDPERIREMWEMRPGANVAVATGAVSRLFVVDVDPKNRGIDSLVKLIQQHGQLPWTPTVRTGSGGLHYYFLYPREGIGTSAGKLADGIDIRGDGGYAILPPSSHASGETYRWEVSPETTPRAEAPAWLFAELQKRRKSRKGAGEQKDRVGEGSRNDRVFDEAVRLHRLGRTGENLYHDLLAFSQAHCQPPPPNEEVEDIARRVSDYEVNNGPYPISEGPHFTFSDVGNAQRLIQRHGDELRYCWEWKTWYGWDGKHWIADSDGQVERLAKETLLAMYEEAKQLDSIAERKRLVEFTLRSERRERIHAMVDLARTEDGVALHPAEMDTNPWLLNVNNGTLDLRTGELREHQREDLITKLAPVDYDPEATCPLWDTYLSQVMDHDDAEIRYLQQLVGLSLTGDTSERIMMVCYGTGRNGKSVFLSVLRGLLGEDYALNTPADTLMKKRDGAIPNDLARLVGVRLVTASETEVGDQLAVSKLKNMVGGDDLITARLLGKEFFQFQPQFKLWVATNHKPIIRDMTDSFWDRLKLIPFMVRIEDDQLDLHLKDKLLDESAGILAWAVRGCLDWQENGLQEPAAVTEAVAAYREDSDLLADFFAERCELGEKEEVMAMPLYLSYTKFCTEHGERPSTQKNFSAMLSEHGCRKGRATAGPERGRSQWKGIGLRDNDVGAKATFLQAGFTTDPRLAPRDVMVSA